MNRVWVYIISKELAENKLNELREDGNAFVSGWTAHDTQLTANFEIFNNRILIFKVDEDIHSASGCSIDKLTRFIKDTEKKFGIELMNRLLVAYRSAEGMNVIHSSKVPELIKDNKINGDTVIFNTSASNSNELSHWEIPLKESWLQKYLINTPSL